MAASSPAASFAGAGAVTSVAGGAICASKEFQAYSDGNSKAAGLACLHGRDDAHGKIGGVGSGHFGSLLIAMRASNQTSAPMGDPHDAK